MLIQWPVKVDVISSLMPPIHHALLSVSHRQWSISLHKSGNHLDLAILIVMGGGGVMEWSTTGAKQAANMHRHIAERLGRSEFCSGNRKQNNIALLFINYLLNRNFCHCLDGHVQIKQGFLIYNYEALSPFGPYVNVTEAATYIFKITSLYQQALIVPRR